MIDRQETTVLRDLAQRVAELAATDSNSRTIDDWTRLNGLDGSVRPQVLVHLWPLAWDEVLPDSGLQCTSRLGQRYERDLRRTIWTAENLDCDNVAEPVIHYPLAFNLDPYGGLHVEKRYVDGHDDGAAEFIPIIVEKSDIDKLGDPTLTVDHEQIARNREQAQEIFSPFLTPVKQPYYFAAKVADEFSWYRGLENTYMDMITDPDWVHEALQRIADNFRQRFHLLEEAGLWGVPAKSNPLGSAGLRFAPDMTDWRTAADPTTFAPTLAESWGFTCAEVFNCVSPTMHDEFGFEYDRQLMSMFKYINVGCCETLDRKAQLIRSLPNARKISVSEWCDVAAAAESIGPDYVYSYRAAGVPFMQNPWNKGAVREEISAVLDATRGCPVEIVLNIGGTMGEGDPAQKLVEWCELVRELL
jgi:hypothetical protein